MLDATRLPTPGDPSVVYVVDISSFVYRAYHALPPLSTSRGEPTHAIHGVTNMLLKLFKERQPALVAIAYDPRGPTKRKELYPEYKANRKKTPPDLIEQLGRVRDVVAAFGAKALEVPGYEADDVIAAVTKWSRQQKLKTVIVSADKDLLQLVGDDVVMYDTMRDKVFGPAEAEEKMGVPPHQIRDLLALMGDSSDNVPGVPKVGAKTAAKLLAAHGSVDAIYENLSVIKGKLRENLENNEDKARLSLELVTLHEDIEVDIDLEGLAFVGGSNPQLRALFGELEFTRQLAQLDPVPIPEGSYDVVTTAAALDEIVAAVKASREVGLYLALDRPEPMRADIIGVGLSPSEAKAVYLPVAHRYIGGPELLPLATVLAALGPLFEDEAITKCGDDMKSCRMVLARHDVGLEGPLFDTSLASYLLDPGRHAHSLADVARAELGADLLTMDAVTKAKRGRHAFDTLEVERGCELSGQQADYALRLSRLLAPRMDHGEMRTLYHEIELPLARVLASVEATGVRIDAKQLARQASEAAARLLELEAQCHELAGHPFNVASPRQLETILFDELELPVVKKTKTARSTDHQVLEELSLRHELPEVILEHRSIAKLKSTYLDALPKEVLPRTGRIHTRYNQSVAATGRLSSSDPNLQNIPIRTDFGRRVRDAFIPEEGWGMLSADYSQIELRVLAHLSEDAELCDAYSKGEDVHVRTATALFDVAADEVTREQRGQAKTVNFAVIYGQTQFALAQNLKIERSEASRYIDAFFERYSGVKTYMDELVAQAHDKGYVTTILGRRRSMADIRSRNRFLRAAAERIARNTPIQGSAADIMKIAMVEVQRRLVAEERQARMLLTVHDELVFEVPEVERESVTGLVRDVMEGAMSLRVPLLVEIGWGASWGAAH